MQQTHCYYDAYLSLAVAGKLLVWHVGHLVADWLCPLALKAGWSTCMATLETMPGAEGAWMLS